MFTCNLTTDENKIVPAACRCTKHRQLIAELDQGSAPPLSDRDAPPGKLWGPLHGTELLDPADLHRIKATEVRSVGRASARQVLSAGVCSCW